MNRFRLFVGTLAVAAAIVSPAAPGFAAEELSRVVTVEKNAFLLNMLDRLCIQYLIVGVPPLHAPTSYKAERASAVLTHWLSVNGFRWRIKNGILLIYRPGDPSERWLDARVSRLDIENRRMDIAVESVFKFVGLPAGRNLNGSFTWYPVYPTVSLRLRRTNVRDSLIAILRQSDKSVLHVIFRHGYGDGASISIGSLSSPPLAPAARIYLAATPGVPPWANDDLPPTTALRFTPKALSLSGILHITPKTKISFDATDTARDGIPAAGIQGTDYWIDVPAESTSTILSTRYAGPFSLPQGRHTIAFFSMDKAGNQEESKSAVIVVDRDQKTVH